MGARTARLPRGQAPVPSTLPRHVYLGLILLARPTGGAVALVVDRARWARVRPQGERRASVTAPSLALATVTAYFAKTPRV